jgi:hypothetical protein
MLGLVPVAVTVAANDFDELPVEKIPRKSRKIESLAVLRFLMT